MINNRGKVLIYYLLLVVFNFATNVTYGFEWPFKYETSKKQEWTGKWFPQPPNVDVDDNPSFDYKPKYVDEHNVTMGVASAYCDDAKTNLTLDWDNSPIDYMCFKDKHAYLPNLDVHPLLYVDPIPKQYVAQHKCMDIPIYYDDIPTFGPHRPLWAKYGEYKFLPAQRWVHNLEHGAVVMLYHPCANRREIDLLRRLITNCLYRHIITPHISLKPIRPLALVAWGYRFEMSKVDPLSVVKFVRSMALRGPEKKSTDGQFDYELIKHSKIISDEVDSVLCPSRP